MLEKVFEDIKSKKKHWFQSASGADFEASFATSLKNYGFIHIMPDNDTVVDVLKNNKNYILNKTSSEFLSLNDIGNFKKGIINSFVKCPYGSQQFPDFIVFTESKIVPIEIKYSKEKSVRPMWNSNYPKSNGIYVFGSHGQQDITFFLGNDVLPMEERELLDSFFDDVKKLYDKFQQTLKENYDNGVIKNDRGFNVYPRKAYDQTQTINKNAFLNYFEHSNRETTEQNVIDFCRNL